MRRLPVLACLSLFATPAIAGDEFVRLTPEQIGQAYCLAQTGNDSGLIEGLLSKGLKAIIDDAEARSDAIQKQRPDEKPPLGDGIPWHSFADYPPVCNVTGITQRIDPPSIAVTLSYEIPDYPQANWSDTLILVKIDNDVLRIDDLEYSDGAHIRPVLVQAFDGYN